MADGGVELDDLQDDGRQDGMTLDELETSVAQQPSSSSTSNAAVLKIFESRKISRSLAVPTNDNAVRLRLRELGEPITCFAEANVDRRERLREILLREKQRRIDAQEAGIEEEDEVRSESEGEEEEQDEEFFTEGDDHLLRARQDIAWYSLARARRRIEKQKEESKISLANMVTLRKGVFENFKRFTLLGSQPADDRPISIVRLSPDGSILATGSWSGNVKLWDIPSASPRAHLRGHSDKVGGIAWHPHSILSQSASSVNLATGAADSNIHLWSLSSTSPLSSLKGHAARVARVAFHPSGSYLGSASFDGTWRLWDVSTQRELLLQEGHSKEVYSIEFHPDGSLCASGGLDAIGRLWDLRTGRSAMVLDGHAKEILSIDFHPNGYQVATASGDDTVRIWDMRALKSIYTIPAHKSSVADVRFFRNFNEIKAAATAETAAEGGGVSDDIEPMNQTQTYANGTAQSATTIPASTSGLYLATAGYDGLLKIWSSDDWQLLRTLSGDNGKVMSCDVHSSGEYIVSGEWGRSFKIWGAL